MLLKFPNFVSASLFFPNHQVRNDGRQSETVRTTVYRHTVSVAVKDRSDCRNTPNPPLSKLSLFLFAFFLLSFHCFDVLFECKVTIRVLLSINSHSSLIQSSSEPNQLSSTRKYAFCLPFPLPSPPCHRPLPTPLPRRPRF